MPEYKCYKLDKGGVINIDSAELIVRMAMALSDKKVDRPGGVDAVDLAAALRQSSPRPEFSNY